MRKKSQFPGLDIIIFMQVILRYCSCFEINTNLGVGECDLVYLFDQHHKETISVWNDWEVTKYFFPQKPATIYFTETNALHKEVKSQPIFSRLKSFCIIFSVFLLIDKLDDASATQPFKVLSKIITNTNFAYSDAAIFILHIRNGSSNERLFKSLQQYPNEEEEDSSSEEEPLPHLFHAPLILLNMVTSEWAMYCNLCPPGLKIAWHRGPFLASSILQEKTSTSSPPQGGTAYIMSNTPGEMDNVNNPNCTSENYQEKPSRCQPTHVILGIIAKHFNLTLTPARDGEEHWLSPTVPGLHICLLCNTSEQDGDEKMKWYNPKVFKSHVQTLNFIYCYFPKVLQYQTVSWSSLTSPFDVYTWVMIIVSAVAMALFHRDPDYGFDIFGTLLAQSLQRSWSPGLSSSLLVLIVLTNAYLGMVTTGLTRPLGEKQILDLHELIHVKQYKFLVGNKSEIPFMMAVMESNPKYRGKVKASYYKEVKGFHFQNVLTQPFETFRTLGENGGFTVIPNAISLLRTIASGKFSFRIGQVTCSLTEEKVSDITVDWILRLSRSTAVLHYRAILQSSGIPFHWGMARLHKSFLSFMRGNSRNQLFGTEWEPLTLESSIQILFMLYGMLLACSAVLFFSEVWKVCTRKGRLLAWALYFKFKLILKNPLKKPSPKMKKSRNLVHSVF